MDVFATKDGKVYKVSLKNFIAATNKKAPYYKRVKVKGKTVEKAYAICPACGNPVHFVNLFNKSKKKKAHVRHQRSSIKRLAKYNSLAYENCPFVKGEVDGSGSVVKIADELNDFCSVMVASFGISKKNARLLGEIYSKLQHLTEKERAQQFFALLASVSYNFTSRQDLLEKSNKDALMSYGHGIAWNAAGDVPLDDDAREIIIALGFKAAEVDSLFKELYEQHISIENKKSSYYGKLDLTHLCATAATLLSDKDEKSVGDFVSGVYVGIASTDANTGYVGDLCGTDGAAPSMNDGDYKADLDAVNIAQLMRQNPSKTLLSILVDYLEGIEAGSINRAREFKKNIGIEKLKTQRREYENRLKQADAIVDQIKGPFLTYNDEAKWERIEYRLALFDKFIDCIEREEGSWPDD